MGRNPVKEELTIHPIRLRAANAYIIESQYGLYLVDCGMPGDEKVILNHLSKFSPKHLRLIYLTHAHIDHAGSAAKLRLITGAPIAIHNKDADALQDGRTELGTPLGRGKIIKWLLPMASLLYGNYGVTADVLMNDLDQLEMQGLKATVFHTPGHTPGSSSLLTPQGDLFVGDLISTNGGIHAQRYFATDWQLLQISLTRIIQIKPKNIYPGHGEISLGHAELRNLRPGL